MRVAAILLIAASLACSPPAKPVVAPRMTPQELAARVGEADRLASRGCYLCLKEAAAAYSALLALSEDPDLLRKALENNLMLVARETELRMPDSGAREAAAALQARVPSSYDRYLASLETTPNPLEFVRDSPERKARLQLLAELETEAHASAMKGYFYLALAFRMLPAREIQPKIDAVLAAHPHDLSIKYKLLGYQATFSAESARELIGMETGFSEVHFLLGQRAMTGGNLANAFRELTRARELLPDSVAITLALANVTFSYARYGDSLVLFDRVLANPAVAGLEPQVRFGRARALSYLKRHEEAIVLLDELLVSDGQNTPGEKYYWRAWNRLQLGQSQLAYDDATTGLNAMRNDAIYRLAGIASLSLNRSDESRSFFESALDMNRADCDSERYLGLLDSAERSWKPASARFLAAAACYDAVITRMRDELAGFEQDITGLSNGLIAAKRAEISEAETLRTQSANNAAAATKNAGSSSK